jgi:hypothetical protein
MSKEDPVILDLAPLPREQLGPFLVLGVDKDASPDQIEANWAKRLIWARKGQFRLALEDVNWAREILTQPDQRLRADILALNLDTIDGTMRRLSKTYGADERMMTLWEPVDATKVPEDSLPTGNLPDPADLRASIRPPLLPPSLPAAAALLASFVEPSVDPWELHLTPDCNLDRDA